MKRILPLIIIGVLCLSAFSILTPRVKADSETILFQDDFESYEVGIFPSACGWALIYDGMGVQYQKVINTVSVSGLQSFQLWGQYMWSACSRRSFSTDATIIGYEVNVRVEDYGTYWLNAFFSLWSDATETDYMQVSFHSDGKIYVYSYVPIWYSGKPPGPKYDLETTYEPDTWYNIRVIVNRETDIFNVWINNVIRGENLQTKDSFALNALRLGSSHAGVQVYYDDVKVFEGAPPSELRFTPPYDESMSGHDGEQGWRKAFSDSSYDSGHDSTSGYGYVSSTAWVFGGGTTFVSAKAWLGVSWTCPKSGSYKISFAWEWSVMASYRSILLGHVSLYGWVTAEIVDLSTEDVQVEGDKTLWGGKWKPFIDWTDYVEAGETELIVYADLTEGEEYGWFGCLRARAHAWAMPLWIPDLPGGAYGSLSIEGTLSEVTVELVS